MLPDRVSKPGPLTYESGALPFALRGRPVGIVMLLQYYGMISIVIEHIVTAMYKHTM